MGEKYLSLREIQMEELKILKKVINFLKENNLTYYLAGGTLIGAVRHKGFIPWDDDIDIIMPRPDYNKFIELSQKKKIDTEIEVKSIELKNLSYPFCKVVNKNIEIISKSQEDKNLWMDVFPIDAISDNEKEKQNIMNKIMRYKGIIYLHNTKIKDIIKENKNISNKCLKLILKPIANILSPKYLSKKIIGLATKANYNETKKLGAYVWGYGLKEILDRKCFEGKSEFKFEDIVVMGPIGYKEYLTSIYGDYMALPPQEKRIQHNIIALKK